jgi:hypothetical protein
MKQNVIGPTKINKKRKFSASLKPKEQAEI